MFTLGKNILFTSQQIKSLPEKSWIYRIVKSDPHLYHYNPKSPEACAEQPIKLNDKEFNFLKAAFFRVSLSGPITDLNMTSQIPARVKEFQENKKECIRLGIITPAPPSLIQKFELLLGSIKKIHQEINSCLLLIKPSPPFDGKLATIKKHVDDYKLEIKVRHLSNEQDQCDDLLKEMAAINRKFLLEFIFYLVVVFNIKFTILANQKMIANKNNLFDDYSVFVSYLRAINDCLENKKLQIDSLRSSQVQQDEQLYIGIKPFLFKLENFTIRNYIRYLEVRKLLPSPSVLHPAPTRQLIEKYLKEARSSKKKVNEFLEKYRGADVVKLESLISGYLEQQDQEEIKAFKLKYFENGHKTITSSQLFKLIYEEESVVQDISSPPGHEYDFSSLSTPPISDTTSNAGDPHSMPLASHLTVEVLSHQQKLFEDQRAAFELERKKFEAERQAWEAEQREQAIQFENQKKQLEEDKQKFLRVQQDWQMHKVTEENDLKRLRDEVDEGQSNFKRLKVEISEAKTTLERLRSERDDAQSKLGTLQASIFELAQREAILKTGKITLELLQKRIDQEWRDLFSKKEEIEIKEKMFSDGFLSLEGEADRDNWEAPPVSSSRQQYSLFSRSFKTQTELELQQEWEKGRDDIKSLFSQS